MSKRQKHGPTDAGRAAGPSPEQCAVIAEVEARCAFGPLFFLTQLRGFVRDRCPDPAEIMPVVEVYLHSGEGLDLCHVIGAAPRYVVLAVHDEGNGAGTRAMRTELVPYELIMRVTIRAVRPTSPHMGFNAVHAPEVIQHDPLMTPEEALRAAAMGPPFAANVPAAGKPVSRKVATGTRARVAAGRKPSA